MIRHSLSRPAPTRRTLTAATALLVAAAILAVAGCSGASTAAATPYGSGRGAPTLAQVTALLNRHARAVLEHAAPKFLADVDPGHAAEAFRAQQGVAATALAAVPLQVWSYTVSAPVTDLGTVRAAAAQYGAPATIVHLTLSYAFEAVDPAPVTHDLWWTFVQRKGHVYVAGDSNMAGLGGQSWRGPWDFGAIAVHRGTNSLVLGHPVNSGSLDAISSQVDAAVSAVAAVWGTDWNRQVAVIVPASAAEFAALGASTAPGSAGTAPSGADISAETIFETSAGVDSAGRVLMNPVALDALTDIGRQIVLRHEITHVATIASTPIGTPTWLVEGFAEYVGNLDSGQSVATAASELRAAVRRGQLPTALPSESDFGAAGHSGAVYEQAWLACRLIAAKAGQAGLVHFYRLVGASLQPAAAAVASALRTVLRETPAVFTAQWIAYLRAALR